MHPLILLLEKKSSELKQQGQKKILVALFTGIGSATSSLVGVLLSQLLENPNAFYWGTILSSQILIPASILTALSIWDKLKIRWSESDNLLYQKKYIEDEFIRNIQILENSGIDDRILREKLYSNYERKINEIEFLQRIENKKYLNDS